MTSWYDFYKYDTKEKCRTCIHHSYTHIELKDDNNFYQTKARWLQCSGYYYAKDNDRIPCSCKLFVPTDNLLYLEYLNEQD